VPSNVTTNEKRFPKGGGGGLGPKSAVPAGWDSNLEWSIEGSSQAAKQRRGLEKKPPMQMKKEGGNNPGRTANRQEEGGEERLDQLCFKRGTEKTQAA